MKKYETYYVPPESHWPLVGTVGLALTVLGAVGMFHGNAYGSWLLLAGACITVYMMYGWFSSVINESLQGLYSQQMDHSFRWGMVWFIFSEVMFFAAFFGVLYYVREFSVPWLGGEGAKGITNMLWQQFESAWPLLNNPDPNKFEGARAVMDPWGLPAINTLILLTSGATITWAHHGLKDNNRKALVWGLFLTIALGLIFLSLQGYEYKHAYDDLGLKLNSGIYGATFFMLTGFHGFHVTVGTIMLIVIWLRSIKGHFTADKHFAFEGVAWYWHFVDVVWLILFIFVYWL